MSKGPPKEEAPVSIVILRRTPLERTQAEIESVIASELGIEAEGTVDAASVVARFRLPMGNFLLTMNDAPYVEDVEATASEIGNERLREAFRKHRAWSAIDWLDADSAEDVKRDAYRVIGKLTAGLLDFDCLMLFCPELSLLNVIRPDSLDILRGDEPLDAFEAAESPEVVDVPNDDPRLLEAIEEARRRWPEVAARLRDGDLDILLVKARFEEAEHVEHMWIEVESADDFEIHGTLRNAPRSIPSLRDGDRVTVSVDDLNDWVYSKGEEADGAFTQRVIEQIVAEREEEDEDEKS